jgi:hypothetical protein
MRWLAAIVAAIALTSCASMPDIKDGGLPLARSGWRMTGGADFDKKVWFVMFWRPWGRAEQDAAAVADKIVLPE